ncbi:hypothetical protein Poly51_24720 [Rubripirellula tenax]|uniref:Uncharacterized protein n=1 Tax=Rubripirellula tenax TaxID=2528015 RepID=A0A5C6F8V3_9BACT|nr:hypothetical protein [Rubripirellula tenax]TWU56556.1 hypothetical protein Poly51_24720 [Rubripirellula tenax]
MEKKFKAKDKLAKRAERKIAVENGTFEAGRSTDPSMMDDETNEDDPMDDDR